MNDGLSNELKKLFNTSLKKDNGESIVVSVQHGDVISQIHEAMVGAGDSNTLKLTIDIDDMYEAIISINNPHALLIPIKILQAQEKINTLKKFDGKNGIIHVDMVRKEEVDEKVDVVMAFLNNSNELFEINLQKITTIITCTDAILNDILKIKKEKNVVENIKKDVVDLLKSIGYEFKNIKDNENKLDEKEEVENMDKNYIKGNKTLH